MAAAVFLFAGLRPAYAQFAAPAVEFNKVKTHLEMDGRALTQEEQRLLLSDVGGEDLNKQWRQGSNMRNVGFGFLTGAGGVCALALGTHLITISVDTYVHLSALPFVVVDEALGGGEIIDPAKEQRLNSVEKVSGYVALGAGVVTGIGALLFTLGNKKLNRLTEKVSLEYNVAPTGAGLTLYF